MNIFEPYLPDREHYFLNCSRDGENYFPINMSKRIEYLKGKIGPHRNNETDLSSAVYYSITDYDGASLYTRNYQAGETAKSTKPYHIETSKSKTNYTLAYIDHISQQYINGELKNITDKVSIKVICDNDGKIVTDLILLSILYDLRYTYVIPAVISNKALVSMATYKPLSKETFIQLPGLGEKIYNTCGELFISTIRNHIENDTRRDFPNN